MLSSYLSNSFNLHTSSCTYIYLFSTKHLFNFVIFTRNFYMHVFQQNHLFRIWPYVYTCQKFNFQGVIQLFNCSVNACVYLSHSRTYVGNFAGLYEISLHAFFLRATHTFISLLCQIIYSAGNNICATKENRAKTKVTINHIFWDRS